MPIVESELAAPGDPRFAVQLTHHATSAAPVWLWSADGSRILWANAAGAAVFDATTLSELATRRFDAKHPAAAEIARLSATLPPVGQPRLERLRGFGARFGRALTCTCSRFPLSDGAPALLIVAGEPVGRPLTLRERVSWLFSNDEEALAVFAPDGTLLHATAAAQRLGAMAIPALGISALVSQALNNGSADGATSCGPATVERLGSDTTTVLVVVFHPPRPAAAAAADAELKAEPAGEAAVAPSPTAAAAPTQPTPPAVRASAPNAPVTERRHPLRFVWQMDADGRFTVGSDEFVQLLGPRTNALFGRPWSAIAADLKLDPQDQVGRALTTRETWSGITIQWPLDDGDEPLPIEMSGLPVFGREREFLGYRGFGVCRDVERINQRVRARRERVTSSLVQPEAVPASEDAATTREHETIVETHDTAAAAPPAAKPLAAAALRAAPVAAPAANVVPFRPAVSAPEPKAPSLSPVERQAFGELAQELSARLQGGREPVTSRAAPAAEHEVAPSPPREETVPAVELAGLERAEEPRRTAAPSLTAAENEIRELRARLESFSKTEEEMRAATREAYRTAAAKAEFVSKVSHEIRTPLNTITGFAEVIMAERFGPIGNERYREYVKDIHTAGIHVVSLLNDLVDLSKVESGQLDMSFGKVSLNDLTQQCVGIMQPQASRARIIIRTSLTPGLPEVVADERSLRQIVLNLLSNSIRFTGPGGQVIVSTAFADNGEAVLRVRDTGVGMSEKDIEAALEPFRQTETSASWGSGGTGLGLPLTKALTEANRAHFSIKSAPNAGTLIEVAFPPVRVVAR